MIFVYFDKSGVIKETINDNKTRVGNSYSDRIYFYFEDELTYDNLFITLKRPDDSVSNEISIHDDYEEDIEIPYDNKRDLKYFENYKKYNLYFYELTSEDTKEEGLCVATIRAILDGKIYAQGLLTFNVQKNIIKEDHNITQSQYDYLITLISSSGSAGTSGIKDGAVTTKKIKDGAVTSIKIANKNVTENKLSDDVVAKLNKTFEIGNGTISEEKLANDVQQKLNKTFEIGQGSITSTELGSNSVISDKIYSGAVTTDKIADENVTMKKLSAEVQNAIKSGSGNSGDFVIGANSVGENELKDNAVTTSKIKDSNVTSDKLATSSVTTDKILNGNVTEDKLSESVKNKLNKDFTPTENSLDGNVIKDNTILGKKIANANIDESKLSKGIVEKLNKTFTPTENSLDGNVIKEGTISLKRLNSEVQQLLGKTPKTEEEEGMVLVTPVLTTTGGNEYRLGAGSYRIYYRYNMFYYMQNDFTLDTPSQMQILDDFFYQLTHFWDLNKIYHPAYVDIDLIINGDKYSITAHTSPTYYFPDGEEAIKEGTLGGGEIKLIVEDTEFVYSIPSGSNAKDKLNSIQIEGVKPQNTSIGIANVDNQDFLVEGIHNAVKKNKHGNIVPVQLITTIDENIITQYYEEKIEQESSYYFRKVFNNASEDKYYVLEDWKNVKTPNVNEVLTNIEFNIPTTSENDDPIKYVIYKICLGVGVGTGTINKRYLFTTKKNEILGTITPIITDLITNKKYIGIGTGDGYKFTIMPSDYNEIIYEEIPEILNVTNIVDEQESFQFNYTSGLDYKEVTLNNWEAGKEYIVKVSNILGSKSPTNTIQIRSVRADGTFIVLNSTDERYGINLPILIPTNTYELKAVFFGTSGSEFNPGSVQVGTIILIEGNDKEYTLNKNIKLTREHLESTMPVVKLTFNTLNQYKVKDIHNIVKEKGKQVSGIYQCILIAQGLTSFSCIIQSQSIPNNQYSINIFDYIKGRSYWGKATIDGDTDFYSLLTEELEDIKSIPILNIEVNSIDDDYTLFTLANKLPDIKGSIIKVTGIISFTGYIEMSSMGSMYLIQLTEFSGGKRTINSVISGTTTIRDLLLTKTNYIQTKLYKHNISIALIKELPNGGCQYAYIYFSLINNNPNYIDSENLYSVLGETLAIEGEIMATGIARNDEEQEQDRPIYEIWGSQETIGVGYISPANGGSGAIFFENPEQPTSYVTIDDCIDTVVEL